MRIFLTDLDNDLPTVQVIIADEFSKYQIEGMNLPAISYVGAVKLPLEKGLIEIECESIIV